MDGRSLGIYEPWISLHWDIHNHLTGLMWVMKNHTSSPCLQSDEAWSDADLGVPEGQAAEGGRGRSSWVSNEGRKSRNTTKTEGEWMAVWCMLRWQGVARFKERSYKQILNSHLISWFIRWEILNQKSYCIPSYYSPNINEPSHFQPW